MSAFVRKLFKQTEEVPTGSNSLYSKRNKIEIVPDKIHYIIEIREYFKEEFDGKSKPEEYHTKVPLSQYHQKGK